MLNRTLIALLLLIISTAASAQKLDLSLSPDTARFSITNLIGGTSFGRTELTAGFLFNEDDNTVFDIGLQVIDLAGTKTPGLEIGVGPRLYFVSMDNPNADGAALALGGNLRYKSPDIQRLAFYGDFYFAPGITSFMDADGMTEFGLRVAYEIHPTADAYVGYRRIRMEVDKAGFDGSKTVDSGIFLGIRLAY